MKVLQVNASYKPAYIYGGPTMSVSQLSEQLVNAGCSVQVFTTTANGTAELPIHARMAVVIDGVPVYYFRRLTKDHSHFSPQLLRAVWQQVKQFDVVHIHAWWNTVSVLSCLIAVIRGIPVVVSPRGTLSAYSFGNRNTFSKRCIHWLLGKHLLERATIHATSAYEKEALAKIIKPKEVFTIPNFIELPDMISKPAPTRPLKLLFFSRVEEKKGLDILLKALPMVNTPYRLTIAGKGNEQYIANLKQLSYDLGLADHIDWVGFVGEDKFSVLAAHHLLVLPSYDENFGNVVIESLAVGTAVLVSEQVGLSRYVAGNKLGWVCQTEPGSIATAIGQVTPDRLREIALVAPDQIRKDHDKTLLTKKYIDMYQRIIQNG